MVRCSNLISKSQCRAACIASPCCGVGSTLSTLCTLCCSLSEADCCSTLCFYNTRVARTVLGPAEAFMPSEVVGTAHGPSQSALVNSIATPFNGMATEPFCCAGSVCGEEVATPSSPCSTLLMSTAFSSGWRPCLHVHPTLVTPPSSATWQLRSHNRSNG